MDKSPKETSTRPRRPRSVPPPEGLDIGLDLPGLTLSPVVLARFRGQHAPLAALAAQLRTIEAQRDTERAAVTAGRLARQLSRRQAELREVLALAEKSLAVVDDPSLGEDLATWWALAGDLPRAAALLQGLVEGRAAEERSALFRRAGEWLARAGKARPAAVAFERAAREREADPRPLELLGGLGFWADVEAPIAAGAYLEAAGRRAARGEDSVAFEDHLRAFEVDPTHGPAAEALARVLVARGRAGAAEDVLRLHLRLGPAARRVAHYQRRFLAALEREDWQSALGAALEAELDVELDPDRLAEVLVDAEATPRDFEGLLVRLVRRGDLGAPLAFGTWLLGLLEFHASDWGVERVARLVDLAKSNLDLRGVSLPPALSSAELQEQRRVLSSETSLELRSRAALTVARAEARRGAFHESSEGASQAFGLAPHAGFAAALALFASGRTRAGAARAVALLELSRTLPLAAAAEVASLATEGLVVHGALALAADAAHVATLADPAHERAVSALALVALRDPEEASPGQLEVSLSVLVARAETCVVLGRAAEARGAGKLAASWAERAWGLRPADPAIAAEYLRLAAGVGDAEVLSETFLAVLREPLPLAPMAGPLADALRALVPLDPERAQAAARKLLDVGARAEECRQAVLDVAQRLDIPELLAQMLERELVVASASARPELLLDIARARFFAGEFASAARAARRALSLGAEPEEVHALVARMPAELEPDGLIALRETESELRSLLQPEDRQANADALWNLGVLRWDMAEDTAGAVVAFQEAAEFDSEDGLGKLAFCLTTVAGSEEAARVLEAEARETESPERSGRLLSLASRCMFDVGKTAEAFRLGCLALERAPRLTEVLAIVEQVATPEQVGELESLYEMLARSTMGCYAERAVRYRAARQLERRGALESATRQAIGAFHAVPAEGVAFIMMARLADRLGKSGDVVLALEQVASRAQNSNEERARWLEKAAALADTSSVGRRQRVDILLRAAGVRPEESTLRSLSAAIGQYLEHDSGAREELAGRFSLVVKEAIAVARGAYGALLATILAQAALEHFDDAELALGCLERAIASDLEIVEYQKLSPWAERIGGAGAQVRAFLDHVRRRYEQEGAPLGRGLAELCAAFAEVIGDLSLEAQMLVRAATDAPSDSELVARARQAATRAKRDDLLQIVEDLLPVSERARSVLSRVESMSTEEALDALLEIDIEAAEPTLRVRILGVLADRQERIGRLADARDSFKELLSLLPGDETCLRGLERIAEREQDYEELGRVLRLRAEAAKDPEDARRISLRRAVVLETQLGRAVEARTVLEELLVTSGDSWAVLRVLADSWERAGDYAKAAELWLRARGVAPDPESVYDVAFRAAQAYFEAGEAKRAREALQLVGEGSAPALELRLAVERSLDDPSAVMIALAALAEFGRDDAHRIADWFMEAADIALDLKEFDRVEEFVQGALAQGIDSQVARLLACQMRVRREGICSAADAQRVVDALKGTQTLKSPKQRELRSYLLAEAKEFLEPAGVAVRELENALAEQGKRPLLAVALAERLSDFPDRSLELYEMAVGGDLQHMRRAGDVLLAAGSLARQRGQFDRAQNLLSAVRDDDPRRPDAARELEAIAIERTRHERLAREQAAQKAKVAQRAEEEKREIEKQRVEAEKQRVEIERQRVEAQQKAETERRQAEEEKREAERVEAERVEAERADEERREQQARAAQAALRPSAADRAEAIRLAREADAEARAAITRAGRAERESRRPGVGSIPPEAYGPEEEALRAALVPGGVPTSPPGHVEIARAPRALDPASFLDSVPELVPSAPSERAASREVAASSRTGFSQAASSQAVLSPAVLGQTVSGSRAPTSTAGLPPSRANRSLVPISTEREWVAALEAGDIEAGRHLLEHFAADRARSRDAVVVAGHLVNQRPGDAELLGLLAEAAQRNGNDAHAQAVRHVLGSFGGGPPVVAPPLADLIEQPEAVRAVLWRGVPTESAEVLSIVWESATNLFKRDIASFGVSGSDRLVPTGPQPLAIVLRHTLRLLGLRASLYRTRPGAEISMDVMLTVPPSVLLGGSLDDASTDLVFHLGAMLAATLPENALLYGSDPNQLQDLLAALALSFGPRDARSSAVSPQVTRLAGLLWETVPGRLQRRLTQLCAETGALSGPAMTEASRRVLRRAGLVACGDVAVAVADACQDVGIAPPNTLDELRAACQESHLVHDLLGLALSSEYAELRFRSASTGTSGLLMTRRG